MNITESEYEELLRNVDRGGPGGSGGAKHRKRREVSPKPVSGPLEVTLVLHGHCPSKKNLWAHGKDGMFLPKEVSKQIELLTTQALFAWPHLSFVEHPEITVKFFVRDARRDQDGMYVTILDCLQAAGVLRNDNCKHNNGRKVLEPCEFVKPEDERVEITIKC